MTRCVDQSVLVVPYDDAWPIRFEHERKLLEAEIGEWLVGGIHHVGSTAVPGLPAKPVIDILGGVEDLDSSRGCFPALGRIGYAYAPYRSEEMHWFCKPSPSYRTHHLHLLPSGSQRFLDELAFRNRLRVDPALAREYARLKRRLAASFKHDREAYTEGKDGFIQKILDESR